MTPKPMRFAIFGNTYQLHKSSSVRTLLECLGKRGAEIVVDREYHDFLASTGEIPERRFEVFNGRHFEADFAVSMGGDGTFLKAADRVGSKEIPIVGVNMGRLGFLADAAPDEIESCIANLYAGDYSVEERMLIMVDGGGCALNDVAILKRDNASMISIRAMVNGEYLTTYQADGVVISTPTGSTAYSLSNGGPIIVPGTSVVSMTAVAPHSLNSRPIVLPDSCTIELEVESRSHNFLMAIDGRSENRHEGTRITITKAPYCAKIVKRSHHNYFKTLRAKMMWGADIR